MKIVTNIQNKEIGGIVRYMDIFLDKVKVNSVDIVLACVYNSDNQEDNYLNWFIGEEGDYKRYELLTKPNYYISALDKSRDLSELKIELKQLINKYIELLQTEKPDVVLINGTYFRPWCLMLAAKKQEIPFVVVYHGSIVEESRGIGSSKLGIMKDMELDFYNPEASYIFPSKVSLEASYLFAQKKNIKNIIIPNPVDDIFFVKKVDKNLTNNIGFILRWEKIKNLDFVLDFFRYNEHSLNPYLIKVLTDSKGKEQIGRQFKYVEILPPLQSLEIIGFYQDLDILINPSFFETFGYAPAESIANGTPALVSSSQGISEILNNVGLERLIIKFNNVEDVYNLLPEIIKKGITNEEYDLFRKNLDASAICEKIMEELFKKIT